jgi:AraC-like DNA-binding protein
MNGKSFVGRLGFVGIAVVVGVAGLTAVYLRARRSPPKSGPRSLLDYLLLWPLILGKREKNPGENGRLFGSRELIGWVIVIALAIAAVVLGLWGLQGGADNDLAIHYANYEGDITVAVLADQACVSLRHFSRAFRGETGMSPAKAVEQLRAEAARGSLSGTGRSVQDIARAHGLGNSERMRRTFLRLFGVTPPAVKHQVR